MKIILLCCFLFLCLISGSEYTRAQVPPYFNYVDGWLEFDQAKNQHVDHGVFWTPEIEYGKFFWEAWVMPYEKSGYIISDGYGGRHNLLFGLHSDKSSASFTGNVWSYNPNDEDFGELISFGAIDTVPINEWVHTAVSWDGKFIRTYLNGIVSGITPFNGVRMTVNGAGSGNLYVGGSDHINFNGRIAKVRGFENEVPPNLENNFAPDLYFKGLYTGLNSSKSVTKAAFVSNYSTRKEGYTTTASAPKFVAGSITKPTSSPVMPVIPKETAVFDSFSRQNQTKAFDRTVSLGLTETTSGKGLKWNSTESWGIFAGRAVAYSPNISYATVSTNIASPNFKISVDRPGKNHDSTGVTFDYIDDGNNLAVYTEKGSDIFVTKRTNNDLSVLAKCAVPKENWTTMSVEIRGTILQIGVDGKEICVETIGKYKRTQNVGLMKSSQDSIWRWDNFTVTELQ
jgi:hypothetical protein